MLRAMRKSLSGTRLTSMEDQPIPQDSVAAGIPMKPSKLDEKLGDSSTIAALTQRVHFIPGTRNEVFSERKMSEEQ